MSRKTVINFVLSLLFVIYFMVVGTIIAAEFFARMSAMIDLARSTVFSGAVKENV